MTAYSLPGIEFMETPTTPPARSIFRRILFAILVVEALILLGYIAVAQILHLDPTGESYWQDTTTISLGVLFILVVPAFILTWLGGYALVPATPIAAFGMFMCLIPTSVWVNWSWKTWLAFIALLALCAAAVVRYEKKRAV